MSIVRMLELAKRLPVTLALTLAVTVVFGLEWQLGGVTSVQTLMRMGALHSGRVVSDGETWRLLTPMFLHYGWLHFLLNTLALVQLAALVELLFGSQRLIAFYLVSGLVGNLASALFNPAYQIGQVGASGAIFGLAGLVMGVAMYGSPPWREQLARPFRALTLAVSFSVSLLVAQVLFGLPMLIDHFAHAGGFLTGLLLAAAYPDPTAPTRSSEAALAYGSVGALVGAFLAVALWGDNALESLPDDTRTAWEARIELAEEGLIKASLIAGMEGVYTDVGVPDPDQAFRDQLERCAPHTLQLLHAVLYSEKRQDEELWTLEQWVVFEPEEPNALNGLAWTLLTHEDEAQRDPKRALLMVSRALEALEQREPEPAPSGALDRVRTAYREWGTGDFESQQSHSKAAFLDTRAEALFQLGRLQEALTDQREAVDLGETVESDSLAEMKERLQRIEQALGA